MIYLFLRMLRLVGGAGKEPRDALLFHACRAQTSTAEKAASIEASSRFLGLCPVCGNLSRSLMLQLSLTAFH